MFHRQQQNQLTNELYDEYWLLERIQQNGKHFECGVVVVES